MKVHIGVGKDNGLDHTTEASAAIVHDLTSSALLLLGDKTVVYADSFYQGIEEREEMHGNAVGFHVVMRLGL